MKTKIVVLTLVAVMLVGGCGLYQLSKNLLCNPTVAQVNTAKNSVAFLDWGFTLIGQPGISAAITAAVLVFNRIRPGMCVTLDELEAALNTVDQVDLVIAGQEEVNPTLRIIRPRFSKPDMTALRMALR